MQSFVTKFQSAALAALYNRSMTQAPHVLIVDDDREIRQLLADFLAKHGYRTDTAGDVRSASKLIEDARFDLIVLDLMLPGEDGLSFCRRLRANSDLPVIMLTALAEDTDRIVGLEMGADDYLVKPFNPRELLARVKAVLRRTGPARARSDDATDELLAFAGWTLDIAKRELRSPENALVAVTAGEFDLLLAFATHPQRVLTRDQLLDLAKGRAAGPFDRSIDVQLSRLRRKIETDPGEPQLIKTVRNGGYTFTPKVERR
jgi:two-component system, OmpR family, response regulator